MGLRIHQLSAVVANQIAAGEVIERPASVVKELLENALDSGATTISIDIGFGGLNHVKVSDNGVGIVADDLPLAIAAHATSKITQLNDLYAITSMGFRGEALASIASISRLSLSSKPFDQEHAMTLFVEGETVRLAPCARTQGTTIDVRDLFFNAPVRKKFLKTPLQEYKAIESIVKRFALSAPAVALTLSHNDKQTLSLPSATCEQTMRLRIQKLLGKEFFDQAIYVDVERAGMRLHGWVSGASYQRSQNDKQWIYINQRMVKDKLLNHALKQAYEQVLHPGRHPACALYLTLPPNEVDVNVHPTKHEVRFQQPRLVHDLITSQIVQALTSGSQASWSETHSPSYPTEIRESYSSQLAYTQIGSIRPLSGVVTSCARPWLVFNSHFAIVFLYNEPYLLDMESLQNYRLIQVLTQKNYLLDYRPLLVPVRYAIDKFTYPLFEQRQPVLATLGVQFDFMSQTHIVVRTIPKDLPLLDISRFFARLSELEPTLPVLLNALVASQLFDAQAINDDEEAMLTDYLNATPDAVRQCCRRLDVESCRGLLYA